MGDGRSALLVVVRYEGDSERKRLEYLLERYRGKVDVKRPSGAVLLVEGDEGSLEEFLQALLSRVERGRVEVYDVRPSDRVPSPVVKVIRARAGVGCSEVLGALGYVMARLRGSLYFDLGSVRTYVLRTRRGVARARVEARGSEGGGCSVVVEVEGYEPAVSRVYSVLTREISLLGEVDSVG